MQFELPFEHGCSLIDTNCFNESNTESWKIIYGDQVNRRVHYTGQAFVVAYSWYYIDITIRIKKNWLWRKSSLSNSPRIGFISYIFLCLSRQPSSQCCSAASIDCRNYGVDKFPSFVFTVSECARLQLG